MGELIILAERRADRSRPGGALVLRSSSTSPARSRISPPSGSSGCSARSSGCRPRPRSCGGGRGAEPAGGGARARGDLRGGVAASARVARPLPGARPRRRCGRPHTPAEIGAGARFALAASRLAFCGGFDLEDPEILAEAAAAAGIGLRECLAAAGDPTRDGALHATARGLLARGVRRLPAIRIGERGGSRRWRRCAGRPRVLALGRERLTGRLPAEGLRRRPRSVYAGAPHRCEFDLERPSVPLKGKREEVRLWVPRPTDDRRGRSGHDRRFRSRVTD